MKRKVTVTTNLNQRIGEPSLNAPCYAYLAKGSIIEVDGHLYEGDTYKDIDKWYKDEAGNYYWSGGVYDELFEKEKDDKTKSLSYPWNINKFQVQKLWKKTKGKGVNVAILDTGYSPHPNFNHAIKSKFNFLNNTDNVDDFSGHGTHVTGILASNGNNGVYGISPEVNLHIGKVVNFESDGLNPNVIASAINYYSKKVDMITMSLGFEEEHDVIKKAVSDCKALIVAAYGNDVEQKRSKGDFPAEYKKCVSVGSLGIKNDTIFLAKETIRKDGLNITAPGQKIMSTYLNGSFKELSGSSMATPYITGVLSLIKSKNLTTNLIQLKDDLISYSKEELDNNYQFNQINILKFIEP